VTPSVATDGLEIRPLAESGLLVVLGDAVDRTLVARVAALTAAIDEAHLAGVVDVVPSYATIMLAFDPTAVEPDALAAEVRRLAADPVAASPPDPRRVEIPVAYGGEHGPDLGQVATHADLAPDEIVARHAAGDYAVASMGFAPGFGFLVGLPPELATPRRTDPRTRVPPGSVGIGGAQTGVYSLETPGGWHLIGRTPLRLFDLDRDEPALLRPGDRVAFRPIPPEEYRRLAQDGRDAAPAGNR
jgi:KipI family sensor histidine kinase inhibitor